MLGPEDQAGGLRRMRPQKGPGNVTGIKRTWSAGIKVVAVTSGKGGVGKSTLTTNLAIALANKGARVLVLDGDLGLANLDQMLGVVPRFTLQDVLESGKPISEVITECPSSVKLLPACSGKYDMANLTDEQRLGLFNSVDSLEDDYDVLIVDTGAGIGSNSVSFAAAAQDVIVVTTPEPTSIRDAFAMIKVLGSRCRIQKVRLVANMVVGAGEAAVVHEKLQELSARFFDMEVDLLGHIVRDGAASKAIRAGQPLALYYPRSPASRCIHAIARSLTGGAAREAALSGGIQFFWRRLLRGEEEV